MRRETSFYIMPYVRIYKIDDEELLVKITDKVEKAISGRSVPDEDIHAIVEKIISTSLFDNVFDIE